MFEFLKKYFVLRVIDVQLPDDEVELEEQARSTDTEEDTSGRGGKKESSGGSSGSLTEGSDDEDEDTAVVKHESLEHYKEAREACMAAMDQDLGHILRYVCITVRTDR